MVAVPAPSTARRTARRTPVIHVARDSGDGRRWTVRREGDGRTHRFIERGDAAAFARHLGQSAGAYRLFLELRDGRVVCEMLNVAG